MKNTILVLVGYTGVGKTSVAGHLQETYIQTHYYHIASPFKEMLSCIWPGVNVNNRETRLNVRPTGGKTVGELMASAFQLFRQWDDQLLFPTLGRQIEEWVKNREETGSVLIVDGVRTREECKYLRDVCFELPQTSLLVCEVTRKEVPTEMHLEVCPEVNRLLGWVEGNPNIAYLPVDLKGEDSRKKDLTQLVNLAYSNPTEE